MNLRPASSRVNCRPPPIRPLRDRRPALETLTSRYSGRNIRHPTHNSLRHPRNERLPNISPLVVGTRPLFRLKQFHVEQRRTGRSLRVASIPPQCGRDSDLPGRSDQLFLKFERTNCRQHPAKQPRVRLDIRGASALPHNAHHPRGPLAISIAAQDLRLVRLLHSANRRYAGSLSFPSAARACTARGGRTAASRLAWCSMICTSSLPVGGTAPRIQCLWLLCGPFQFHRGPRDAIVPSRFFPTIPLPARNDCPKYR